MHPDRHEPLLTGPQRFAVQLQADAEVRLDHHLAAASGGHHHFATQRFGPRSGFHGIGGDASPLRLLHHLPQADVDESHAQRARVPRGNGDVIGIACNSRRDPTRFVRARLRRFQRERLLDAGREARGGAQPFANARGGIVRKRSLHQDPDGLQGSRRGERREGRQRELAFRLRRAGRRWLPGLLLRLGRGRSGRNQSRSESAKPTRWSWNMIPAPTSRMTHAITAFATGRHPAHRSG